MRPNKEAILEQLSPEQFISAATATMSQLSPKEAFRIFEHASSWTTVFYNGDVPQETANQLNELEMLCRRCLITRADG